MPRKAGGSTNVIITGTKEIDDALKSLPIRVRNKVVRASMRKGMKIVQSQAQSNAPVKTGELRRAIKVRSGKWKGSKITILVRVGKGDFKGDSFYGSFQEYGWHAGPRRLGDSRPYIAGAHFMKFAFDSRGETAKKITMEDLLKGTLKEASVNRKT